MWCESNSKAKRRLQKRVAVAMCVLKWKRGDRKGWRLWRERVMLLPPAVLFLWGPVALARLRPNRAE